MIRETDAQLLFDKYEIESRADLYQSSARPDDGITGLDAVSAEHVSFFREQGYLIVHDAFTGEEVQAARDGLLDLIDGKVPEFTDIQFEATTRDILPTLTAEQKRDTVRRLIRFVQYDARLQAMAMHPRLLAVMTSLVGDTPRLFQDMALLKPPFIGREKPWHQDNAFFNVPPDTAIAAAWIALDEAMPENGCMYIIPGSHRLGPVVHFNRRDWQICDTDVAVNQAVAVPLRPGGCLFFHGLLHHGTPPSQSPRRRHALQFHYKPATAETTTHEDRMAVFGSEGKDVSC